MCMGGCLHNRKGKLWARKKGREKAQINKEKLKKTHEAGKQKINPETVIRK